MKSFLVVANWKMHKTPQQAGVFLRDFRKFLQGKPLPRGVETAVAASHPLLPGMAEALSRGKKEARLALAAQDAHFEDWGAFTGAVSPLQLKALGVRYVIAGHSERRQAFGESDETVARKLRAVRENGMTPILCVGERFEERLNGAHERFVGRQLEKAFRANSMEKLSAPQVVVAYEPVWAIGTGRTASPDDAQGMHALIADWCLRNAGGRPKKILYGGSVNPANAGELLDRPGVEGLLVGGASLEVASFSAIVMAAADASRRR